MRDSASPGGETRASNHDRRASARIPQPGGWGAGPGEVDVWVLPLDVEADRRRALVGTLDPEEQERARRFRHPGDARRWSVGRGWFRAVLGARLGLDPAAVAIVQPRGAKPILPDAPGIEASLSRAGGVALVAVAGRAVGVDVEHLRPLDDLGLLVAATCTPAETAAIEALRGAERHERFLALWTAKEAFLKARGTGLAVEPATVALDRPWPTSAARIGTAPPARMGTAPPSAARIGTAPAARIGTAPAARIGTAPAARIGTAPPSAAGVWTVRPVTVPGCAAAVEAAGTGWTVRTHLGLEALPVAAGAEPTGPVAMAGVRS